jgi:hypothetical protein
MSIITDEAIYADTIDLINNQTPFKAKHSFIMERGENYAITIEVPSRGIPNEVTSLLADLDMKPVDVRMVKRASGSYGAKFLLATL